ncbi:MAG TPA: TRAP transporter small permease [Alphaproteobacteria bacterium]
MLALVAAMLLTVVDVALRRPFDIAIKGTVDLTQLLVMAAAWLAIPYAFLTDGHVSVPLLVDRLPARLRAGLAVLAALLGAALLAGIAWYGTAQARLEHGYGEISLTLGIAKHWYWLPLIAGAALSVAACAVRALAQAWRPRPGRG